MLPLGGIVCVCACVVGVGEWRGIWPCPCKAILYKCDNQTTNMTCIPNFFILNHLIKSNRKTIYVLTFPGSRSSPPGASCTVHVSRTGWQRKASPSPWWQSSPSTGWAGHPSSRCSRWAWRPPEDRNTCWVRSITVLGALGRTHLINRSY